MPESIPVILLSEGHCPNCRSRLVAYEYAGYCMACKASWWLKGGLLGCRVEQADGPGVRQCSAAESARELSLMPATMARMMPSRMLDRCQRGLQGA